MNDLINTPGWDDSGDGQVNRVSDQVYGKNRLDVTIQDLVPFAIERLF